MRIRVNLVNDNTFLVFNVIWAEYDNETHFVYFQSDDDFWISVPILKENWKYLSLKLLEDGFLDLVSYGAVILEDEDDEDNLEDIKDEFK